MSTLDVMASLPFTEGRAPFGPYETWYRVTGDPHPSSPPLVVVRRGAGAAHN
ncbi:hypothetical protein B1B_11058, partial [mine drainage metagenome]